MGSDQQQEGGRGSDPAGEACSEVSGRESKGSLCVIISWFHHSLYKVFVMQKSIACFPAAVVDWLESQSECFALNSPIMQRGVFE